MNFCASILTLKMEGNAHFQCSMLYYSRKVKIQLKPTKNSFMQCMEKVLLLIEHVKMVF